MEKVNADGWIHYPGRYAAYESVSALKWLWFNYRDEYRKYFTEAEYMLFRNSFTVSPPNGENYGDVVRRVTPFLEELKKSGIRKAVIVSHAIAIRCMLKVVKNLPEEETLRIDIRQCEPIRAEY